MNSKLTVSPLESAYSSVWYTDVPEYGPNGGDDGVLCSPRSSVPTYASSVPLDCCTPPMLTSAVSDIEVEKSVGSKLMGGGDKGEAGTGGGRSGTGGVPGGGSDGRGWPGGVELLDGGGGDGGNGSSGGGGGGAGTPAGCTGGKVRGGGEGSGGGADGRGALGGGGGGAGMPKG